MTDKQTAIFVIIISLTILAIISVTYSLGAENGYRQGQIDCINGTINYELVRQDDNTTTWERIDE